LPGIAAPADSGECIVDPKRHPVIVRSIVLSLAILLVPCIVQAGTVSFPNRSGHQVPGMPREAVFGR